MFSNGLQLFIAFVVCWVAFWATFGGLACRKLNRPVWRGVVLGGILAPIGILLALLTGDERSQPRDSNTEQGA